MKHILERRLRGESKMFKFNEEYGNLHIDGTSINIDKINLDELTKYLEKLERRRENVIEQQNEYLSQIIK